MTFLHILKEADSPEALEIIGRQTSSSPDGIGLVLIQDAKNQAPDLRAKLSVLKTAREGEGTTAPEENDLDYGKLVDLIFDSEKVVVW